MDFALLYYGDLFYPTYDESGRGYLYVEGELGRDTVGLVLCSDPRTARWLIGDLREERPHAKLLVMGRTESLFTTDHGLRDRTRGRKSRARQRPERPEMADVRPYLGRHGAANFRRRRFCTPLSGCPKDR